MKLKLYTHENCPACKRMEPIYEKVASMYPTEVIDPTTDEGAEMAWRDNVMSSPTLLIFSDMGHKIGMIVGVMREAEVYKTLLECKEMYE